ncbi:MAG: type II toxin-antitoxin system VapC family toxin [Bifidobacteriaceae bacterium]|jgi:predicted nucleic acid-binding protein|nr:type II toxin-antitoxin system VapC family toxin [Bifidobacteriaceae bacterium]
MIVIDASLTMTWCFEDESTPATEAILDRVSQEGALVPQLWRYEVVNALAMSRRRERLTEAEAQFFLSLLDRLAIVVDSDLPDGRGLLAMAQSHRLTAYDAAYFLLAARRGLELATLDQELAAAARAAGLSVAP